MTSTQRDAAYERIQHMIVTLQLEPGGLIDETELMKVLNTGRTPIRQALQHLAQDRLVVIRPRQGTYVSEITLTDFHELIEARTVFEREGVRLAAERIMDEELLQMRNVLDRWEELVPGATPEQSIELESQFHGIIAEATRNKYIRNALIRIEPFVLRLIYFSLDRVEDVESAPKGHVAIYNALKRHDPDEAEQRITVHLKLFRDLLAKTIVAAPTSKIAQPASLDGR